MAKYKKVFALEAMDNLEAYDCGTAHIIGQSPKNKPYVTIYSDKDGDPRFIKDKDLERFAINILKAIKSKRLKS